MKSIGLDKTYSDPDAGTIGNSSGGITKITMITGTPPRKYRLIPGPDSAGATLGRIDGISVTTPLMIDVAIVDADQHIISVGTEKFNETTTGDPLTVRVNIGGRSYDIPVIVK